MVIYRWKIEIDNRRAQVPTLASEGDQYPAEVLRQNASLFSTAESLTAE
jgi:hypothetical protein